MGLKRVKWNFEKFLIGRDGKVKGRWASTKKPLELKGEIEKELAAGGSKSTTDAASEATSTSTAAAPEKAEL